MKIVAMGDLGALGNKEGAPVHYNLILPNQVPPLLPWLGILLLLTLKSNRCGRAWWILAPLALVAGIVAALQAGSRSAPGQVLDIFGAVAFGVASLWLLAPYLRRSHRCLTFFMTLLVLAGCSGLTYLLKQGWSFAGSQDVILAIMVLVFAGASAVALGVVGLLCKTRYSRLRLALWLMPLYLIISCLILIPFFVFALISSGSGPGWLELLTVVLVMAAIGFGILLPFLVLSFVNGLYGERLKSLLHVGVETPPAMLPQQPTGAVAGTDFTSL